jgi:cytidylate kinase
MIPVIAIDGPAASGKSSTGLAVARELGWHHLDTGSLYRGLTRVALDLPESAEAETILAAARSRVLGLHRVQDEIVVVLDGHLAEAVLRGPEIAAAVSRVAAMPAVREWATEQFQAAVRANGATVLDGRDIGTAVCPDAPLKIYLTASPEARAGRRLRPWGREGTPEEVQEEAARLAARDLADSSRAAAPLARAPGAVEVDTTRLTPAEQVERILDLARQIWLP